MAFRKQGINEKKKPNFIPLLNLVIDDKETTHNYYPLRNANLKYKDFPGDTPSDCNPQNEHISLDCFHALIDSWVDLPTNQVIESLYPPAEGAGPVRSEDRVKYYTFDKEVTQDIYKYFQNRPEKANISQFFYLYLGWYKPLSPLGPGDLRVIIQANKTPPGIDNNTIEFFGDGDEDFEFSRPCPAYCDPPNS